MVGAPYQTPENLADDMLFLKELNPQMVGIGPLSPTTTLLLPGNLPGRWNLLCFCWD